MLIQSYHTWLDSVTLQHRHLVCNRFAYLQWWLNLTDVGIMEVWGGQQKQMYRSCKYIVISLFYNRICLSGHSASFELWKFGTFEVMLTFLSQNVGYAINLSLSVISNDCHFNLNYSRKENLVWIHKAENIRFASEKDLRSTGRPT